MLANYQTISHKDKVIKSTTILIRDQSNKPIGALCINFDLALFYNIKKFFEEFTRINKLSPSDDKVIEINNADKNSSPVTGGSKLSSEIFLSGIGIDKEKKLFSLISP